MWCGRWQWKCQSPGLFGDELDVTRLGDADEHGVLGQQRGRSDAAAFSAGDVELMTVNVHRVMIHPEVDQTNPHSLAELHDAWRRGGTRLSVQRQPVELHRERVGDGVVREERPFLQDDAEVTIDARRMRALRVDDEEADQAHHLLHRHVRVIEERAVLLQRELVDESAARRNRILRDPRHAVHLVGISRPCQCIENGSGSPFSTLRRTRSPSLT